MAKLENGGNERREQAAMGVLRRAERTLGISPRSPERALLSSTVLTVLSFSIHILFLFLVDPLRVLNLSKETAYSYSAIPLCFGVIFLISSIYNFIKIEDRTGSHIILLLIALSIGSMSLQGLLGLGLHYVKISVLASQP